MFSIQGQVALVTGGAVGIGQAIAIGLAQAGADVAIVTPTADAHQTQQAVEAAGRRFHAVRADLMKPESAAWVVAEVEAALGPIGILVNNAGIIRREWAEYFSDTDWQDVIELNLNAVWRMSQTVGRGMLERGRGKIINIASLLSFQGGIRVPSYTASKHAVAGLTKALANEWAAKGVNVNAIAPGYIATDNTAALRADPERSRQILERIPAGRWGEPSDLVGAAVFLASPASDYVNGHILVVDGGWMAR
ncbi:MULTISPECIES: 2-dehydro-3-deoxy-D-gluconate 5-dehydrogenase KduD [unclassified Meiothermus]|uniref:2-dehydro-3-deoxy-D-gluconate 5-dehydrogenase KduD n=1 Tax=unclassified Meiothermus TaxID=370471 RepID=UPI000D7C19D0|nr:MULTISPECIES: 2-dehydro-3-deoxy-D-gluconate 5-dehydrogenase KduD [unclassified Meiothermus]PZA05927.1 2-deoxy-D-gluconate 3-dehydrogenase [Meiothermus sp. Pnk-1]RYM36529.1 2-dehydro-3-deoxy-D-gluconate 5-dehydrogenase KduD [Meiothermus sp. PNK-Is4]